MKKHKIKRAIPLDQKCFAVNNSPIEGIGLRIYVTEDKHIVGLCKTKKCHQGYGGMIHGGMISIYFDEVLWYATVVDDPDTVAVTAEMSVKYLAAIPIEDELRIIGKPMKQEGRHIYVEGYILLSDGEIAAEATAHFIITKSTHTANEVPVEYTPSVEDMPTSIEF